MATTLNAPCPKSQMTATEFRGGNLNLYVIIPVHNRIEYTRSCLWSLSRQTIDNFKVVVIDDGSTDGTSQMIETEFPDVVLLRGDGNLWWTRAVNLGVKYALARGADYLITLNDDIIVRERFIEMMLLPTPQHPNALLGGIPIDAVTKQPIYGGKLIDWRTAAHTSVLEKLKPEDRHGLHEVDHLPGRALLIPAKVFKKIGLFDEINFPQSTADFDFTHRAYKADYEILINYDSQFEVYPDSKGGTDLLRDRSLRKYYQHLFGIKGKGNLKHFIQFGWKHCPKAYLPSFIIIGTSRRIFGYLFEWLTESFNVNHPFKRS
jgi:GT2 family glycosyltransferase